MYRSDSIYLLTCIPYIEDNRSNTLSWILSLLLSIINKGTMKSTVITIKEIPIANCLELLESKLLETMLGTTL